MDLDSEFLNTNLSEQMFFCRSSLISVDGKTFTFSDNGAEEIPFQSDFCRTALLFKLGFHQVRCHVTCEGLTAVLMKITVLCHVIRAVC
jgi:hypothetical protein